MAIVKTPFQEFQSKYFAKGSAGEDIIKEIVRRNIRSEEDRYEINDNCIQVFSEYIYYLIEKETNSSRYPYRNFEIAPITEEEVRIKDEFSRGIISVKYYINHDASIVKTYIYDLNIYCPSALKLNYFITL